MVPLTGSDNRQPQQFSNYPLSDHFVESPSSALQTSQVAHRYPLFDGLPSSQTDQTFLSLAASPSNTFAASYTFPATMVNQHDTSTWISRTSPLQDTQQFAYPPYLADGNYHFEAATFDGSRNPATFSQVENSSVPRTSPSLYGGGIFDSTETNLNSYQTDSIFRDPIASQLPSYSNHDAQDGLNDLSQMRQGSSMEYFQDSTQMAGTHQDMDSWSWSPVSDDAGLGLGETAVVDFEDRHGECDEPYAKLIHKALMSSETHSMVLQDIYAWFRQNTNKGNSESRGWMNSIRHNLSMNAAFKKTERRVPGDDTKKSTEWVLEDFAVKDGVQSTTRYRIKGSGSKKFYRSDASTTARQSSGRKGGLSASKIKSQRHRTKDDRSEPQRPSKLADLSGHPYMHQCRSRFNHQHPTSPSPKPESPPSPSSIACHPYSLGESSYEDTCGLENVRLVDGGGNFLFSDNKDSCQSYLDNHPPYAQDPSTPKSGYRGSLEYTL